ncbi:MAG: hypothetical protein ACTSQ8_26015 [Candidatus Helarchaeota archaeon]
MPEYYYIIADNELIHVVGDFRSASKLMNELMNDYHQIEIIKGSPVIKFKGG